MSPELEALLRAEHERFTCEPKQRARWQATFERLLQDALAKSPGTSREELMAAIKRRSIEYRRAQRKPSAVPPQA